MNYSESLRYQVELSENWDDYNISFRSFIQWLRETKNFRNFLEAIEEVRKGLVSLEWVAMDYSIPVIYVKYWIKNQ